MSTKPKPENQTGFPDVLSGPRAIRLFKDDDDALCKLCAEIKSVPCKMDIVDLIRMAVHEGLPIVQEIWEPLLKAHREKEKE